jgi:aspartate/methionine/tyrosine aminotransferase
MSIRIVQLKIANRGKDVAPFYAMEVLKAANDREALGDDVLHMEVGEPGGGAPGVVVDAAEMALRTLPIGYTEARGTPELRSRISEHYKSTYGLNVDPSRIVVTTGSSGAFLLAFMAAFDPGDKVLLTTPGYPAYPNILKCVGIEPVMVETDAETRFQPTPELLSRASKHADGLLIASPANPTGTMLERNSLEDLIRYCDSAGMRLISDEVYHGITYGEKAISAAEYSNSAIVINSFSKYFSMTGWRLGWMVVPEDMVRTIEVLSQNLAISAPALSQHAALAAFGATEELDAKVAVYGRNRELLLKELPVMGFDRMAPADGAFYIFADVSKLTNDSMLFCRQMLKEIGVATTPGIDFDAKRGNAYVRFSFAGEYNDVAEAVRRLKDWLA